MDRPDEVALEGGPLDRQAALPDLAHKQRVGLRYPRVGTRVLGGDDGPLPHRAAAQRRPDPDRGVDDLPDLDIDVVINVPLLEEGGAAGRPGQAGGTRLEDLADLREEVREEGALVVVGRDDLPAGDDDVGGDRLDRGADGPNAHGLLPSMIQQCERALASTPELLRLGAQTTQVLLEHGPPDHLVLGEKGGQDAADVVQAETRLQLAELADNAPRSTTRTEN